MWLFAKLWAVYKESIKDSAVPLDSVTTPELKKTWEGSVTGTWKERITQRLPQGFPAGKEPEAWIPQLLLCLPPSYLLSGIPNWQNQAGVKGQGSPQMKPKPIQASASRQRLGREGWRVKKMLWISFWTCVNIWKRKPLSGTSCVCAKCVQGK